jgi:hypothetical protein
MRALVIPEPWVSMILNGDKQWEMRGSPTNIRETIALVPSRSRTVVGVCDLIDCIGPLSENQYRRNARKAGKRPAEATLGYYKNTYAWVMSNPRYLKRPVSYRHPNGAIIWVKLYPGVERTVRAQLR